MNEKTPVDLRARVRDLDRRYVRAKTRAEDVLKELRGALIKVAEPLAAYRAGDGPDPGYRFSDVERDLVQTGQSGWSRKQLERWAAGDGESVEVAASDDPRALVRDADRRYVRAKRKADGLLEDLRAAVTAADQAVVAHYRREEGAPDPGFSFSDIARDLQQTGQSGTSRTQLERWARGVSSGRKARARPSAGGHEEPADA